MIRILSQLLKEQTLCAVYTDPSDMGGFTVGIVKYVDSDWFVLALVNPYGGFDGYKCIKISSVIKISCGDMYLNKLAILISAGNRVYDEFILPSAKDLISAFLYYCKENKEILTIELLEDFRIGLSGRLADVRHDIVSLNEIDRFGREDGISYINTEDICSATFLSEDETMLLKLNK